MKSKHLGWLIAGSMIVGCSGPTAYQRAMFDSDDQIRASGDSYYYADRIGSTLSFSFRSFTGSETLASYSSGETYLVEVSYAINQGRFKVVWIEGEDIYILDNGEHSLSVLEGNARLKVVGDNAQGSVSIEVSQPE